MAQRRMLALVLLVLRPVGALTEPKQHRRPSTLPGAACSRKRGCAPQRAVDDFLRQTSLDATAELVVFDVGANNCAWSLAMCTSLHRLNRTAAFHIFEPQPAFAKLISESVVPQMEADGCTVHYNKAAASVREGNATFFMAKRNTEVASLHHETTRGKHLKIGRSVRTLDLDMYLATATSRATGSTSRVVVFFKLDIESAEFEVLPHLLRRRGGPVCRISHWMIEWHLWDDVNTTPQNFEVRKRFESQLDEQCSSAPRIVDHEERFSSGRWRDDTQAYVVDGVTVRKPSPAGRGGRSTQAGR